MNKYGNKKITVDGITFDSKKEARYYLLLREMEKKGEISGLRLQVPYELIPAVYKEETIQLKTKSKTVTKCIQRAIHYVADFVYTKDGEEIVIDVKGVRTEGYKLKKKMMLAFRGIEIREV